MLIDDVPGVAKTLLVRTLAAALGLRFGRVQFTPDLLPADVTGSEVFDQRTSDSTSGPGRSSPTSCSPTRSTGRRPARSRASRGHGGAPGHGRGTTHPLPRPFLVLATQNPVELKGTFPLPEAQLDRFLLRLRMGYPSVTRSRDPEPLPGRRSAGALRRSPAPAICSRPMLARAVHVAPTSRATSSTRTGDARAAELALGASPRSPSR